jgi:hypothetical protein
MHATSHRTPCTSARCMIVIRVCAMARGCVTMAGPVAGDGEVGSTAEASVIRTPPV